MNVDTGRGEDRQEESIEEGAEKAPSAEGLPEDASPEERIAALHNELFEMTERWQRARADYQNLKRRAKSDYESMLRGEVQPLLESLLLVVDHLEMALASPTESEDAQNLAKGVLLTRDQLVRSLEDEGVCAVAEDGAFDPTLHQAVATVESSDVAPGHIVQTVRRGYTWGERVLRPAQVRVAEGAADANADPGDVPTDGEDSCADDGTENAPAR